jgi:hypothetical protein
LARGYLSFGTVPEQPDSFSGHFETIYHTEIFVARARIFFLPDADELYFVEADRRGQDKINTRLYAWQPDGEDFGTNTRRTSSTRCK